MMIEIYARMTKRLEPTAQRILSPFFTTSMLLALRIRVVPAWLAWMTSLMGMPAVLVLGRTIYCVPGVLDAYGRVRGNFWSWLDPRGIALWAHEVKHVEQYLAAPWTFRRRLLTGLLASWIRGHFYDHQRFPYEVEALAFEHRVLTILGG